MAAEGSAGSGREGAQGSTPEPAAKGTREGRSSGLVLLLAAALAVCALVLGVQLRRSQTLSARVEVLSAELRASQAQLERYRGRMGQVREGLVELSGQVQALQGLMEESGEGNPVPTAPGLAP